MSDQQPAGHLDQQTPLHKEEYTDVSEKLPPPEDDPPSIKDHPAYNNFSTSKDNLADNNHLAGDETPNRDIEKLESESSDTRVDQQEFAKPHSDGLEEGLHNHQDAVEPATTRWTFTSVVAFISLCLVYVGSQIIAYFTAGALNYMQISIGTTIPNWFLTANTLSAAATLPFVGYITDLLGRRWVCILGAVLCVISSAIVGTGKTFTAIIVGEAFGGVGTGMLELVALAGVAEITPVKWRGISLAAVNFAILPMVPYLIYIVKLEEASSWRWAFMIVGGWNVLGLIGVFLFYKPPPRHQVDGLTRKEIFKRIDYVGFFLSFGGISLFLVGLQAGGYQFAWTNAKVLAPLIIGILMMLLFPLWEWKGTKYPLVPFDIFRGQRVVGIAYVMGFIAGMNFFALLAFYPAMLQKLFISTPITIGIRSLGAPLGILIGGMLFNVLLSTTRGHVRMVFFIAAIIMTAFGGSLAAARPDNPKTVVALATVAAFGIGAFLIPSLAIALYACPDRYIGTTAALSLTIRFVGASVGTTIYYNIFNTKLSKLLPEYVAAAVVPLGYPVEALPPLLEAFNYPDTEAAITMAAQTILSVVPDSGKAIQILLAAGTEGQLALAKSLSYVWYSTIAFGACAMVVSLMLPNIRSYMTKRVAVMIH